MGSSHVQLFEMKENCETKTEEILRRIVVMDLEDNSQLMVRVYKCA